MGRFSLSPQLLLFKDVRTLRISSLGIGLQIIIVVMKEAILIVKSPDVKCVNLLGDSDSYHSHATKKEYQARRHWGGRGQCPPIICQTCFWRCYKRSLI